MKKRIISLILAVVLVIGCLPLGAGAYSTDPRVNCTYIAWKMATDRGFYVPENWGNGADWYQNAKNAGYRVEGPDYGVTSNSIACWGGGLNGWGHVAYVLDADTYTVTICEGGTGGDPRTWSPSWDTMKNGRYAVDEYGNRYPMYLQGYIILNAPPVSNITLDTPWASDVWETNAVIHSVIRNGGASVNCSNFGFQIWEKSSGKLLYTHKEDIPSQHQSYDHIDIWLNLYDELGLELKRGTEYICQFSTEKGGKTYRSEKMAFQTKGASAPSVATLSIDKKEVLVGENITFTCASDTASGYTLGVNKGGTRVLTQEVPSGTFTTSFQEPGEYNAYVSAYNDSGMLDSARAYFTVKAADGDTPFDPTPDNDFIDVPNGAYFTNAVNWAVENGITAGTTKTTFSPNQVCTRGQAVTFLWRAAGSPKPTLSSTQFTDVPLGKFYFEAVLWAVENGITGGVSATRFAPDDKCTRAQIVSFMYRMKGSPTVSGVSPFLDVPPQLYYSNAVAWAVEQGITAGTSATLFSPHNDCSRGQIVTFLYRGR